MSGFGSFSPEAYEQLRDAYAKSLLATEEAEGAGVRVGADTLPVETGPVRSDWLNKTGLWQYPSGRGDHLDVEQKQQDLLAALRNGDGDVEIEEDEVSLDDMSDDEIDAMINEILVQAESDEEPEAADLEGEDEDEETDPEFEALMAQVMERIAGEDVSDEELDSILDELLGSPDEEIEQEPQQSAADLAAQIAELKAQLAELTQPDEAEEEPGSEEEPAEPEEPYEEDPSDDESN
jgi:hypothetical protein